MRERTAKRVVLAFATLAAFLFPRQSFAQANYEGAQIGGRTAMMGGAVVATGEDQATAFINPAGITRIPGESFSFSTVGLTFKNRIVPNSLDATQRLGLAGADVNRFRLRLLPNTFCLFLNGPPKDEHSGRSRHKYALCAASTERDQFDFTRAETDSPEGSANGTSHATHMKFVRSTLALTWGLALDRDTSIGVTFRTDNARFRDHSAATTFSSSDGVGRLQTLTRSTNAWSWDTSLVVGLTSKISRNVTLGASLTTPSQHLVGRYTGIASTAATGGAPHTTTQDVGDFRYNHPGSLRTGLAFTWPRLVLEVNSSFYGPQRQLARANFDRTTTMVQSAGVVTEAGSAQESSVRASIVERGKPVTNLSFGAEYFIERDFSLVSGFQTDYSGVHPRDDRLATDLLFRQQKNTYHAAIGVSSYGKRERLLIGLRGSYSSGSILMADAGAQTPGFVSLPQSEWGVSLILSGRISFRTVADTAARAATPLTQIPKSGDDERSKRSRKEKQDSKKEGQQ